MSHRLPSWMFDHATFQILIVSGMALAVMGQLSITISDQNDGPSGMGVTLLVLGMALFAVGSTAPTATSEDALHKFTARMATGVTRNKAAMVSVVIGIVLSITLVARLAQDSTSGWDLTLWFATIAIFAIPFTPKLRKSWLNLKPGHRMELASVLVLVGIFLALNIHDLGDWRYSAIGDEYAFYQSALQISENGITNPFSQDGVYSKHPVLNSAYQGIVMTIFGRDNLGWKLSSVLSIALTIPGVYVIGRVLGNRRVAVISVLTFAFSHYLLAYAHTGYNNIHALAPVVWGLALFLLGLRKGNLLLLYAAGVVAGLGFYTFFSARAALPVMLIFALTAPQIRRRILDLWPVALGAALTVTPMFIVSGREVISRMLVEVPGGYSSDITGPVISRVVTNLAKNLLAFNYNPDVFHYVSGPLLDPITAVLAVLGVGLAVVHIRQEQNRLLLLWVVIALTATGILSPYPQVGISRLNFVVPPLVLLAGFAADRLWTVLSTDATLATRRWVGLVAVVVFSLFVLALNVRQFWIVTPRVFHLTQEAVAIGALRSESCGDESTLAIIVGRSTEPLLKPALESYYAEYQMPRLIDHNQLDADMKLSVGSTRCVVFANPDDDIAQSAIEQLKSEFPLGRTVEFSNEANLARVTIFEIGTQ